MGLLDILNQVQAGSRGQAGVPSSSGGMSPMTIALLGLLAYKAYKAHSDQTAPNTNASPGSGLSDGGLGGLLNAGLGSLLGGNAAGGGLGGLLGGLLGGNSTGSVLSGGLNDLLKQLQQSGQGDTANSWVGKGPNQAISPNDLGSALGSDQINELMAQSGLSRSDLLAGLSQHLPQLVDQLTPDGRLPTEHELSRRF